jgi:hypothetical protein
MNEARREMNRVVKGLEKRLDKRLDTFPEGEYVLITRCMIQNNRTGTMKHHIRMIGSGLLKRAVETHWDTLTTYYPSDDDDDDDDDDVTTNVADTYLDMPIAAIPRATKLRDMMRQLWILEGHSNTKQIYNAVAKGDDPGFSWWTDEFPDIPFTNKAVESSEHSVRIYRIVAPKLYERLVGHAPITGEEERDDDPFVRCEKKHHITGLQQCSLRMRHRGVCNMMYIAPVVREPVREDDDDEEEEDPRTFYSYLRRVGHKKEPFLEFTTGQIKQLGIHLDAGANHLAAYRLMGLNVSRKYETWYKNENGTMIWNDIARKFPRYLDDHVLNPRDAIDVVSPALPKRKKPKKKSTNRKRVVHSTRQMNARKKKQRSLETAGFV